ncbi:hypothetical protein [Bacteriovorax sp. Seq25_V]|uniref:hypothetical protein n=1 Tax=Bacteriovorax sp. Seq25_V TaxID=1201288 RepID=UPI00038A2771|nr:hypothetical protein [Bacteriovorax sp. Seq25_V]EQC45303.1 hypothetical protein M900_2320 [Bacteriovorax sp. Seq25_V]
MKKTITGFLLLSTISTLASGTPAIDKACLENDKRIAVELDLLQNEASIACNDAGNVSECRSLKNEIKRLINKGNVLDLINVDRDEDITDVVFFNCSKKVLKFNTLNYGSGLGLATNAKINFDKEKDAVTFFGNSVEYKLELATENLNDKKIISLDDNYYYGVRAASLKVDGVSKTVYAEDVRTGFESILFSYDSERRTHGSTFDSTAQVVDYVQLFTELATL